MRIKIEIEIENSVNNAIVKAMAITGINYGQWGFATESYFQCRLLEDLHAKNQSRQLRLEKAYGYWGSTGSNPGERADIQCVENGGLSIIELKYSSKFEASKSDIRKLDNVLTNKHSLIRAGWDKVYFYSVNLYYQSKTASNSFTRHATSVGNLGGKVVPQIYVSPVANSTGHLCIWHCEIN